MKVFLSSLTRAFAVIALALMTSCVMYDDGFNQPFFGDVGGYSEPYVDGGFYDQPYYGPSYPRNFGLFSSSYYRGFGGGFGGGFRDPYCNDHNTRYVHSGSRNSRRDDGKVDRNNLRVVGGDLGGKVRPQGTHSADWYRSRGYDLRKLKVEDEDGTRYRPSSSSSRSSSSRSNSKSSSSGSRSHSSDVKTISTRSSGRSSPSHSSSREKSSSSSSRGESKSKSSSSDRKESSGGISRKR